MPALLKMSKVIKLFFIGCGGIFVAAVIAVLAVYFYFAPGLPDVAMLKNVELRVPLKVYSRDGKLIAMYGEERRQPLDIEAFPKRIVQSFLAAEDDRFFEHPGIDYQGLIRAAINVHFTGKRRQGGSTITMQLARNFFLGSERTYTRKIREIFLALRIERELNKNEILELYLNKIYLGNRAYGVAAAANVYYGVDVDELNLAQIAMIAGLPKAPSRYNPIVNAERAILRRNYVLDRLRKLGHIDEESYLLAKDAPVTATHHYSGIEIDAPYVGEMVRTHIVDAHGPKAYNKGYRVFTTIDASLQQTAQQALRKGLQAYDQRHGYRGAETRVELSYTDTGTIDFEQMDEVLTGFRKVGESIPAVITKTEQQSIEVYLGDQQTITLPIDKARWARAYTNENTMGEKPEDFTNMFIPGDVIRIAENESSQWVLSQIPEVAGAFVAVNPQTGGILALTGGYDYNYSKFNRAVQAKRQPGSSFKPFIYSAALDSGYTPASLINDAPVVLKDTVLEGIWRPQNYSGKFFGPTRLREALIKSRNMVSIRLLKEMGRRHAIQHITRFGFEREKLPYNLTLALGSGVVSPLELTAGYAVFANGGYRIEPYLIERIEDAKGKVLYRSNPPTVCEEACQALQKKLQEDSNEWLQTDGETAMELRIAEQVLSKGNAYQIVSMMQDVIQRGTGAKARVIGRSDLAGKTGTTNDQHDAWFSGFNGDIVATTWVGFDQNRPLGSRETGAVAALPIWIEFMRRALADTAENSLKQPEGIVTLRIDPATGLPVDQDGDQGIEETFREEYMPTLITERSRQPSHQQGSEEADIPEQLF